MFQENEKNILNKITKIRIDNMQLHYKSSPWNLATHKSSLSF